VASSAATARTGAARKAPAGAGRDTSVAGSDHVTIPAVSQDPATTTAPTPDIDAASMPDAADELHLHIGRQLGLFMRRSERFYTEVKGGGLSLERAAFLLLGRIVSGVPARLSVLAEDVGLELSTISRQVAALEAAGLVARTTDISDRRASVIEATPQGLELFDRCREVWLGALRDLLADWTLTEKAEFARLFTRFNEAIGAHAQHKHTASGRPSAGTNENTGHPAGTAAVGGTEQERNS
jgi:DNA-binding MarR family transcriptional regulator